MQITHIAYSDESYSTNKRYRSVSVVTFKNQNKATISNEFTTIVQASGLKEFKWSKLRQARERFAALRIINSSLKYCLKGDMRIDVLIWDIADYRHEIPGRNDIENLQRMYYHLFKNVLQKRWSIDSTWQLFPDENSALNWFDVQDYLDIAGSNSRSTFGGHQMDFFKTRLSRDFQILNIQEVSSINEPLCQVADFFAGIGAYSHSIFTKYNRWVQLTNGQLMMITSGSSSSQKSTNSEKERYKIIQYLDQQCKRYKLNVGLKSSCGFKTYDPRKPINFWIYEPQHPNDKAPVNIL